MHLAVTFGGGRGVNVLPDQETRGGLPNNEPQCSGPNQERNDLWVRLP